MVARGATGASLAANGPPSLRRNIDMTYRRHLLSLAAALMIGSLMLTSVVA